FTLHRVPKASIHSDLKSARKNSHTRWSAGGTGDIDVSGVGSALITPANEDLIIGREGAGTLSVEAGGSVLAGRSAHIGQRTGSHGAVTIGSVTPDTSTMTVKGNMSVVGYYDRGSGGSTALINVNAGGLLDVHGSLAVWEGGGVLINQLGQMNVGKTLNTWGSSKITVKTGIAHIGQVPEQSSFQPGTLYIGHYGVLNVNAGLVIVDFLANSPGGQLNIGGSELPSELKIQRDARLGGNANNLSSTILAPKGKLQAFGQLELLPGGKLNVTQGSVDVGDPPESDQPDGQLRIAGDGVLRMNGGRITCGSLAHNSGGAIDWRQGVLTVTSGASNLGSGLFQLKSENGPVELNLVGDGKTTFDRMTVGANGVLRAGAARLVSKEGALEIQDNGYFEQSVESVLTLSGKKGADGLLKLDYHGGPSNIDTTGQNGTNGGNMNVTGGAVLLKAGVDLQGGEGGIGGYEMKWIEQIPAIQPAGGRGGHGADGGALNIIDGSVVLDGVLNLHGGAGGEGGIGFMDLYDSYWIGYRGGKGGDGGSGGILSLDGGELVLLPDAYVDLSGGNAGRGGYDGKHPRPASGLQGKSGLLSLSGGEVFLNGAAQTDVLDGNMEWISGELTFAGDATLVGMDPFAVVMREGISTGRTLTVGGVLRTGASSLSITGGHLTANTIDATGGAIEFDDGQMHANIIQGDLVHTHGRLCPGQSPGILTVTENYTQNGGVLEIELGGVIPGEQYDRLVVSGALQLAGELEVLLIDDFIPQFGHTFDILDWQGDLSGRFENITLPELPDTQLYWNTSELYVTGEISVTPEPGSMVLLALCGLTMLRSRRTDTTARRGSRRVCRRTPCR
ncbi:MAG: hypothetical protein QGH60_15300, partial [Phycisphaerae bacterium]|nr:hypothetical protein [Phycisphaerae bacterium]